MAVEKSTKDKTDNAVFLRGRLADEVQVRELPSGDLMATFRLTVDRPRNDRGSVDSIECVSTRARVRATLSRVQVGAVVEVDGALRRRFWRGATGVASRYSVEVTALSVSRAGRPAGASRPRKRASA
ncbi:single-stranded DNA-binding protein [Jatrophihabitans fulvus]